jgi:hypothetical protein
MIYTWPDKGVARVELGYRAYMEMLKRHSLDFDGPHEMPPDVRALHNLQPEDRGAVYYVYDWTRIERFRRFGRECQPFMGIGIWRFKNARGESDNYPVSKSGQWVAEKNALKDAARRALSFAILALATETFDAAYDQELDLWSVPAPTADWTRDPLVTAKFEELLAEYGIPDEEWNRHIGHNWRYTSIDREEMRQKVLDYVAGKPAVVAGEVAAQTDATSEPPALDRPAVEPTAEKAPEEPAEAVQAPLIVPCSFEGCHEPGADTPEGWLCPTHARKAADASAARSEQKGKKGSSA